MSDHDVTNAGQPCAKCGGAGYYFVCITKPIGGQLVTVPAFKNACEPCHGTGWVPMEAAVARGEIE